MKDQDWIEIFNRGILAEEDFRDVNDWKLVEHVNSNLMYSKKLNQFRNPTQQELRKYE